MALLILLATSTRTKIIPPNLSHLLRSQRRLSVALSGRGKEQALPTLFSRSLGILSGICGRAMDCTPRPFRPFFRGRTRPIVLPCTENQENQDKENQDRMVDDEGQTK
jgi:hypothetical protein